jgi:hypothetical protein
MNELNGEIYPYEQRYWYPHLSPAEAALWHKFIAKNPDAYERVAYDVKVGTAPDFVLQSDDETVRKQASLYRYKIDVIGFKGNQIDIIELKQSATMRAIGQVKGYRKLYVRDVDANARGEDIIITDLLLPDMEHLAAEENVKVVVV